MASVAVLDIGSNSIKILVAARDVHGHVVPRFQQALDVRISAGINATTPRLSAEGMTAGLAAIQQLLAAAAPHSPERAILVATSAVRDAANGGEFCDRVRQATGFEIRILTGDEEANAIGRGLTCDPALADQQDFYLFDLGGGSLECLAFRARRVVHACSLQLGCVRLTEKFVTDPATALTAEERAAIMAHTKTALQAANFPFDLPFATAVATGGTMVSLRTVLGARNGRTLEATSPLITLRRLRDLLDQIAALPLTERRQVSGLPAARADVFPAALATLVAVAEHGRLNGFRHSFYNLRYGLAAEALAEIA